MLSLVRQRYSSIPRGWGGEKQTGTLHFYRNEAEKFLSWINDGAQGEAEGDEGFGLSRDEAGALAEEQVKTLSLVF